MNVGDQLCVEPLQGEFPRLVRITELDDTHWVGVQAILHVDETGKLWESEWRIHADRELLRWEPGEPVAPHSVQGTRYLEQDPRDGELLSHKIRKGATVHVPGDDGFPSCGASLRGFKSKPRRWDAWNNRWCNPRDETSVWLPSFQDVTCKRCLTKQAKGE